MREGLIWKLRFHSEAGSPQKFNPEHEQIDSLAGASAGPIRGVRFWHRHGPRCPARPPGPASLIPPPRVLRRQLFKSRCNSCPTSTSSASGCSCTLGAGRRGRGAEGAGLWAGLAWIGLCMTRCRLCYTAEPAPGCVRTHQQGLPADIPGGPERGLPGPELRGEACAGGFWEVVRRALGVAKVSAVASGASMPERTKRGGNEAGGGR